MEPNCPDKVTAFDSLFTTNHIQMLKILLACVDPVMQRHLAVYVKILELQYTVSFFQKYPLTGLPFSDTSNNITGVLDEIFPLCSSIEKEKMQNFRNIYQNMQNIQEAMELMKMMQELSPEFFSSGNTDNTGFGGMDPAQMAELFRNMFPENT